MSFFTLAITISSQLMMIEPRERSAVQFRISRAHRALRRIYGGFTKTARKACHGKESLSVEKKAAVPKSERLLLGGKAYFFTERVTGELEARPSENLFFKFRRKLFRAESHTFFSGDVLILEQTSLADAQMRRRSSSCAFLSSKMKTHCVRNCGSSSPTQGSVSMLLQMVREVRSP